MDKATTFADTYAKRYRLVGTYRETLNQLLNARKRTYGESVDRAGRVGWTLDNVCISMLETNHKRHHYGILC